MSEPMKNPPARKTQTAKRNYQKEMEKVLDAAVRDGRVPTLFLHSCCAPCSSYVLEYLSQYFSITVFYYNPNISPKEEYGPLKKYFSFLLFCAFFRRSLRIFLIFGSFSILFG